MPTVAQHFDGKQQVVRDIYDRLLAVSRQWGPVEEDPKRTSIHLNRKYAFAGVATRTDHLTLTVKSTSAIVSPRVKKREQASAHRWYTDIKLEAPDDIDPELIGWLRASYQIS